jgi:hypothetical protein
MSKNLAYNSVFHENAVAVLVDRLDSLVFDLTRIVGSFEVVTVSAPPS